ncbi:hypothetical protein D777_02124 [Marinobacter nitratireducens]|uniref:Uncharacterized protein n=1 Tax=Marinobacter nitratireducens TaxID=1137280 RepID=A0A072N0A7_9GAMM|nr:hypothetical protein [Marinobacter nitratireducens]KEF30971.1 hypothetical protein D777_02124 [Marinobacter nitratireducens]TNE96463.1 MAG: hypothetical protein EP328_07955 [Gammaproteobacteria bacterium]
MTFINPRLIGLTQERAIEDNTGVDDLHIGWQNEFASQVQKDPMGNTHRAPVVRWVQDGEHHYFVPRLSFSLNVTETPWLRKILGLENEPTYTIDTAALIKTIERKLLSESHQGLVL